MIKQLKMYSEDVDEKIDLYKSFYEDYIGFDNFIEFRIIDYKKLYKNKPVLFSSYASSYDDVLLIFRNYYSERYNIYVGSNTRLLKSRVDKDIFYRRTFYFDIESIGEKPRLSNKYYYKKLLKTVFYIRDELLKRGLVISVVKESGRGMHVGIKINPLLESDYGNKFKYWFKKFQEEISKNRPFKDIKFSDSVFNISRIESAPGTKHTKYPEKPLRRIIYFKIVINDMKKILDDLKIEKSIVPNKKNVIKYRVGYDSKTIFESPEFQLLINNDDLPEGELHTKIIMMIKILVRDNNIDPEVVSNKLRSLGYDEVIDTPPEDYVYNPMVYNYWCIDNYEYCYDKKIFMNNEIFKKKGPIYFHVKLKSKPKTFPNIKQINNVREMIDYVKRFNQMNTIVDNDVQYIYYYSLVEKIKELSKDEKIWRFAMEMNKPFFEATYFYSYPKNQKAHLTPNGESTRRGE